MSTTPDPPPVSGIEPAPGPSPGPDTEWPRFLFVALYPIVAGAALWVLAMFVFFSGQPSFVVFFIGGTALVIGGGHLWFQRLLEGRGEARPWQLPTVLSTALVAAVAAEFVSLTLEPSLFLTFPLVCTGLCLLGAGVFSNVGERHRFVSAVVSVLVVALLLAGRAWWADAQEKEEQREELMQEAAAFQNPIAVLDAPDWEPSQMEFSDTQGATIIYEPAEYSHETDGFRLRLQTEPMDPADERPLHDRCESEGGEHECEEHGDIVVADRSSASLEEYVARTEFADGLMAQLWTDVPRDYQGGPTMDLPEIDMVELAGQIRAADPGEAEEIVDDAY